MPLQDLIRWMLPREDRFYDLLEEHARIVHEAAEALALFDGRAGGISEVRAKVQELEHRGDKLVHDLEDALARTFVTPLDREDLHKLAAELDDVIDLTNLAARTCELFGVDRPTESMRKLIATLLACTQILRDATPKLRAHAYGELIERGRDIRALEKEGDAVFRGAVSVLFHDPEVDAKVLLKEKEVLEHLENAIDRCDRVAGTLTNLAVKHG